MMSQLNFMKTLLCMVFLIVIASCDAEKSTPIRYIAKRDAATTCEGGTYFLQGKVVDVKQTSKLIKDEHDNTTHKYLTNAYNRFLKLENWTDFKEAGSKRGLSEEETKAIYLYTMDNRETALYKYFNEGLRMGEDRYPIFHYWLNKAASKLHAKGYGYGNKVYRGTGILFKATPGENVTLSGFTSSSKNESVARNFHVKGCAWMVLETKMGVDIEKLSAHPEEREVLIPPQEKFRVDKIEIDESGNQTIHLLSLSRGHYHEFSVELVIAALICSFYL